MAYNTHTFAYHVTQDFMFFLLDKRAFTYANRNQITLEIQYILPCGNKVPPFSSGQARGKVKYLDLSSYSLKSADMRRTCLRYRKGHKRE